MHACLVPWKELPKVREKIIEEESKKENYKGKDITRDFDFQRAARNNIVRLYQIIEQYNKIETMPANKKIYIVRR
jgi:hypothetical protein